ncbi:hypothetical protein D3C76_1274180 [compost metagenome]
MRFIGAMIARINKRPHNPALMTATSNEMPMINFAIATDEMIESVAASAASLLNSMSSSSCLRPAAHAGVICSARMRRACSKSFCW